MGAKVAFQIMSHWQLISSTTSYVHDNTDCGASQSQTGETAAGKEFRNIFSFPKQTYMHFKLTKSDTNARSCRN